MASHDTIKRAWSRFGAFSETARTNQNRYVAFRFLTLLIGVSATAVVLLGTKDAPSWAWLARVSPYLRPAAFFLSLALSAAFASIALFDFGTRWVSARQAAELVKREILLFRTATGVYDLSPPDPAKAETVLSEQLKMLGKDAARTRGEYPPRPYQVKDAQGKSTTLKLSSGDPDNGLAPLEPADYQKMRVKDQIDWYLERGAYWRRRLYTLQVLGILAGLAGSAFAYFGDKWTAWIAFTTILAGALTSWVEFRRLDATQKAYRRAASDLDDLDLWWNTLAPHQQREKMNFAKYVNEVEAVLQNENASWTEDMRRRVADLNAEAQNKAAAKTEK